MKLGVDKEAKQCYYVFTRSTQMENGRRRKRVHWLIVTILTPLFVSAIQINLTWFQTKDDLRKWMEVYRGHRNS